MDPQKSSELRVRLRRARSGASRIRADITAAPSTIHFKLAAALEAAAAHASGLNFDWCSTTATAKSTTTTSSTIVAETVEAGANGPITPKLGQTESRHSQPKMQEPANKEEQQHLEDDEEPELVELVIASPYSSSCSSEDEGVAELQDASASNNFLTTFIPTKITSDSNILHSPLSPVVNEITTICSSVITNKKLCDETAAASDDCNDEHQTAAVTDILALPPFDPFAPQLKVQLIIKQIVSLAQLKQRIVDSSKGAISKKGPMSDCERLAEMEFANIHVKHSLEEFFTFCSCKNCLEYREIVVHLMVDQFKAQHMVVMLVDALIKAYSPMLKNATAHSKFEKLLDENKEIYWMTCGYIYNKMAEHMYFIYDESLSDNMILVLFSAILLVNNPLLLLQILSFHIVCIVKAYAEGFLEIVDPDNSKIPAEEMLKYILDGYDDLCRISEHISCYLFAFENDFLRKFSLTWTMLCQRLYQQHVYLNLTDTMLACIITLKEDELTVRHAALIKKYIQFDDKMIYVDKRWTDIWMELNKFNLSEVERKRRSCLLDVHRIFETVVQDAIELSLRDSSDDNDFYDFQTLENRQLAWQNIMAYMKMKWPDGFFDPPNVLVCEDKCKSCKAMLEYHSDCCKCITCSIAGGPLPPKRNPENTCYKCLALLLVEKEVTFYESKILNVCASDDFLSFIKNNEKRKSATIDELGVEVCSTIAHNSLAECDQDSNGIYHLAWAVFRHLNNRKRYKNSTIDAKFFCNDCEFQACRLARKILNNEIALALSLHLIRYYQPLSMSREELRSILPNIMLYNKKMVSSNIGLDLNDVHDLVVKIYWTFVISIYATYFIEFDRDCPLRLENFELLNNDIKLQTSNLSGNKDDTKFVVFLDKIKGLSCDKDELESEIENSEDSHEVDEIQKKLEEFLKITETAHTQALPDQTPSPESEKPSTMLSTDSSIKKNYKEKSKKCCFDHSDLGDHCKENHSNKKRIKKECNHARMNETRDRLRKKLSQLVNARKNMKATIEKQPSQQTPNKVSQPPTLKTAATVAASTNTSLLKNDGDDDSLECLNTLCKRISHLNTGKSNASEAVPLNILKKASLNAPAIGKKVISNHLTKETINSKAVNCNAQIQGSDKFASDYSNVSSSSSGVIPKANGSGLDMVNEIYELLGTYSKDQTKVKKWINETLSFIEGSSGSNNGKQQPQPTNAKKAAKKAKQKQRKEEEKRILELQDLRAQFHVIYFKEFVDKHDLKELKNAKKRDKKRISELEANIKKLQRAKAKVETAILELIATVKQSNIEFKFSYLPTKEQQLEKLSQLKVADMTNVESCSFNLPTTAPNISDHLQPQQFMISSLQTPTNENLNATNITTGSFSLPYAHANNFPYHHIDLQTPGIAPTPSSFGMIRPPLATPMCYAPPQHQQLSPDVVAAMAANAACNSVNDPSKRIVTIRRVNLPNVPEPQVTVTAKGTSPDKDKLLYTFVNGQLLQNGATISPMPQIPGKTIQVQNSIVSTPSQHVISLSTPALSKTQLKKERRRLALKAAEEAEAAIQAKNQKLLEEELERQKQIEAEETAKMAKTKTKVKINEKQSIPPAEKLTSNKSKKKKKSAKSTEDNSNPCDTVDLLTAASTTSTQRRSSSSTSCSIVIQSSSVSLSSQDTHDNSKNKLELSAKSLKLKNSPQIPTPKQVKKDKQSKKTSPSPTQTDETQEIETPQTQCEEDTVSIVKKKKIKRHKFIDNGQFDNNPFKSLHMQDFSSDSEMCFSSGEENEAKESTITVTENKTQNQINIKKTTKNKPTRKEQVPKQTVENVKKPENKDRSQVRAPTAADKSVRRIDTKKREVSKSTQIKVETQKPSRSSRNIAAKQQAQDQHSKQSQSQSQIPTKQPQNEQRGRNGNQQRLNSQHQQTTNKRSSVGNSRYDRLSNQRSNANMQSSSSNAPSGSSFNTSSHSNRSNNRNSNRNNTNVEKHSSTKSEPPSSKPLSKRAQKQALRNKHKSQKQHNGSNLYSGIPNNMGYFNANEFTIPSTQIKQQQNQLQQLKQCQQQQYKNIQQQMQNLNISNNNQQSLNNNFNSCNNFLLSTTDSLRQSSSEQPGAVNSSSIAANVSIMDQLNRGVQVENLSLPPGITLTKVDPIKSELLRKKSESIKKLAKPLQPQQQQLPQSFHHSSSTIIAPPVASVAGYYGAPYAGVAAAAAAAALGQNGGVIMLETMPSNSNVKNSSQGKTTVSAAAAAAPNNKSSKSKKRRNKSKQVNSSRHSDVSAPTALKTNTADAQPKMVTLRNPMFHNAPSGAPATVSMQQPNLIPDRTVGGLPIAATLSMDQPAAIIKNENGMFTIRNPALQQAVANGLAMGSYRQFGNVNYYTPQEAVAEAAKATQQNAVNTSLPSSVNHTTFSYFSNSSIPNQTQQNLVNIRNGGASVPSANCASNDFSRITPHNNISISCTRIEDTGGLIGDSAVIARPVQASKFISAIGSEIKSAQQQKQKTIEHHWTNFGAELANNPNSSDALACSTAFLGGGARSAISTSPIQDIYPQTNYYNGFVDVFPATASNSKQIASNCGRSSNTGSLFDSADCHMNHNCGDDSPPPTITGFNHYLEGIPNTGVIRYDDASFLKTLMPGKNLNNEVSIHNVNDSNFTRSSTSPLSHRVEISPVYANRSTSENIYEHGSNCSSSYRDNLNEYNHDTNLFAPNSLLNLNELESSNRDVETFQRFNYNFEQSKEKQKVNINLNDLLINKTISASNRTSPYMDENALDNFVQNINALQISATATKDSDEQCSQLNSGATHSGACKNAANGWW